MTPRTGRDNFTVEQRLGLRRPGLAVDANAISMFKRQVLKLDIAEREPTGSVLVSISKQEVGTCATVRGIRTTEQCPHRTSQRRSGDHDSSLAINKGDNVHFKTRFTSHEKGGLKYQRHINNNSG
jgi:hypothetical protein